MSPDSGGGQGTDLFAGTYDGVFRSTNNGTSWTHVSSAWGDYADIRSLAVGPASGGAGGTDLYAGTRNRGVYRSTDRGTSWAEVNSGLTTRHVKALAASPDGAGGTNLFAGTDGGVFLSTDSGTSWIAANSGLTGTSVRSLAVLGTNLIAGTWGGGVFLSTDSGTTWTEASTGLTQSRVYALAVSGTNLYAGTLGSVFHSTDNAASWKAINSGLPPGRSVSALAVSPASGGTGSTNLFAAIGGRFLGGTYGDVFLSTDSGTSWANAGLSGILVCALAVSPTGGGTGRRLDSSSATNLFAGTWGDGVFLSTDNGTSWRAASSGLMSNVVLSLAVSPAGGGRDATNLYAGTWDGGVFLSTNSGKSWTAANTGLTQSPVYALAVYDTNLFAGTGGGGVFLSTNSGTSWRAVDKGLTDLDVVSFAVMGTHLYAGTEGGGVWKRSLSELTSVGSQWAGLPSCFRLEQNYPNPFNPATVVRYELPVVSDVKLVVYDLLGQEVAVLVDERKDAGVHEVKFDGSGLSSGVYFYRLEAGNFVETKRLVLLK